MQASLNNSIDLEYLSEESINRYLAYGKGHAVSKRGKSPESISDAVSSTARAIQDKAMKSIQENDESIMASYHVGIGLFEGNCYLCGMKAFHNKKPFPSKSLTVQADHVIPPKYGGAGAPGHLLPAHAICNDAKGNELVENYLYDRAEPLRRIKLFQEHYNVRVLAELPQKLKAIVYKHFIALQDEVAELVKNEYNSDFNKFEFLVETDSNPNYDELPESVLIKIKENNLFALQSNLKNERSRVELVVKQELDRLGFSTESIYSKDVI